MTNPDKPEPKVPRFGIFHLMTFMTGVAVYLGLVEFTKSFQTGVNRLENQSLVLVINVLYSAPVGAIVAGLLWLVQIKRRTGKYCLAAGHWMLACLGINLLLEWTLGLALMAALGLAAQFDNQWYQPCLLAGYAVSMLLTIPVAVTAAVAIERKAWRWFFALLAASYFFAMVTYASYGLAQGYSIAMQLTQWAALALNAGILVALLVALIRDRAGSRRNDWIHWWGVAVFVLYWIVVPVGRLVAYRFLPPNAGVLF